MQPRGSGLARPGFSRIPPPGSSRLVPPSASRPTTPSTSRQSPPRQSPPRRAPPGSSPRGASGIATPSYGFGRPSGIATPSASGLARPSGIATPAVSGFARPSGIVPPAASGVVRFSSGGATGTIPKRSGLVRPTSFAQTPVQNVSQTVSESRTTSVQKSAATPEISTGMGLRPPSSGLRPPGSGLRPPGSGLRPPGSGLRPPGSGLRPPGSGLRLPSTGIRPPTIATPGPSTSVTEQTTVQRTMSQSPSPSDKSPDVTMEQTVTRERTVSSSADPHSAVEPVPPVRQGSGLRPPGSGLRPPGSGLRPPGSGLRPPGSGIRLPSTGIRPRTIATPGPSTSVTEQTSVQRAVSQSPSPSDKSPNVTMEQTVTRARTVSSSSEADPRSSVEPVPPLMSPSVKRGSSLRPPGVAVVPTGSALRTLGSGLRPPGSGLRPPSSGLRPPGSGLRPPGLVPSALTTPGPASSVMDKTTVERAVSQNVSPSSDSPIVTVDQRVTRERTLSSSSSVSNLPLDSVNEHSQVIQQQISPSVERKQLFTTPGSSLDQREQTTSPLPSLSDSLSILSFGSPARTSPVRTSPGLLLGQASPIRSPPPPSPEPLIVPLQTTRKRIRKAPKDPAPWSPPPVTHPKPSFKIKGRAVPGLSSLVEADEPTIQEIAAITEAKLSNIERQETIDTGVRLLELQANRREFLEDVMDHTAQSLSGQTTDPFFAGLVYDDRLSGLDDVELLEDMEFPDLDSIDEEDADMLDDSMFPYWEDKNVSLLEDFEIPNTSFLDEFEDDQLDQELEGVDNLEEEEPPILINQTVSEPDEPDLIQFEDEPQYDIVFANAPVYDVARPRPPTPLLIDLAGDDDYYEDDDVQIVENEDDGWAQQALLDFLG